MDKAIEYFTRPQSIAVVGVSEKKFGGAIYKTLKKSGYDVYPVHPAKDSFRGDRCYPRVNELPSEVKGAVIATSAEAAVSIVDDAISANLTHLWFQQGNDFSRAIKKAAENGIRTVDGKCILMYAEPVTGVHVFHRFLAKLFRRYAK